MSQAAISEPSTGKLDKLSADERFHTSAGWLDSRHSFSFADHYDPARLGFRALRVINDDRVAPASGFGRHSHRDMEIITYVVSGELTHQDSMGNHLSIRRGEVQRMTAGTLISHSEMNASPSEAVHFLQIWILPNANGLEPSYEQRGFTDDEKRNRWLCIASGDKGRGAMLVHQDVHVTTTILEPGQSIDCRLPTDRHGWLQIVSGELTAQGITLRTGDGLAISGTAQLELKAKLETEALLFDLA
jgi:quercetin 2,3-dioxygenase